MKKENAKNLVVVESPTKAKTLGKYLGNDYVVQASGGHIRDLPKKRLGVDLDEQFAPEYILLPQRMKFIQKLKKLASKTQSIYLAPDPDREGEAIAWHIAQEIQDVHGDVYRVGFNEITKNAVIDAIQTPARINQHKVYAQQARRILDRLVGYMLSPLLWKRHFPGLSAGRVQSVALQMICDREKEIRAFVPEEYWTVKVLLAGQTPPEFTAKLVKINELKSKISNSEQATEIVEDSRQHPFVVEEVIKRLKKKYPLPPFITSTLQQEAYRRYRFSSKKTMTLAQQLYEGLNIGDEGATGLITYHRTDSTRISGDALSNVRNFITQSFGPDSLPSKPNVFKNRKSSQDAHEAIRPSRIDLKPEALKNILSQDVWKLYQIIWQRFVASQMKPALYDETVIQIRNGSYLFEATGEILRFPSFLAIYQAVEEEKDNSGNNQSSQEKTAPLPAVNKGDTLELKEITPDQHFTKPPFRYSEAMLIRELERLGIGRPSTYATIISKIKDRSYTETFKGRFIPTELGFQVTDFLAGHFPDILNVKFTAELEDRLDEIEEGKYNWVQLLTEFYKSFKVDLDKTEQEVKNNRITSMPTEFTCDQCGKQLVLRWGRNGQFLACSGYPECQNTMNFTRNEDGTITPAPLETLEEICEKCGSKMVARKGKFGSFLACSAYPKCRNTRSLDSSDQAVAVNGEQKCDKCGGAMTLRKSRRGQFWGCTNYPKCKNVKPLSTGVPCPMPDCEGEIVVRSTKGRTFYGCNKYPECNFTVTHKPLAESCPDCNYAILVEKVGKNGEATITCIQKSCNYERKT